MHRLAARRSRLSLCVVSLACAAPLGAETLRSDAEAPYAHFGSSVSSSDDWIAVGAYNDRASGPEGSPRGAVYLYRSVGEGHELVQVGGVTVDGASVVTTDLLCSNGVIHVIDAVILPAKQNIAETATAAGQFGTLLAAAKAAGLVPALTGKGPLTVFAPTDEAFAKLPKGTVESLLEPQNREKLANILKFHIVAGRVYSPDAIRVKDAATLFGPSIQIRESAGSVRVNDAKIVNADLDASNGVIHVIDKVLLPK